MPSAMKEKKGVKFCPRCGSTSLQWASGLPQLWSVWECRNCGYRGAFVVEDGKLAERIRETYSQQLKQDEAHIHDHKHASEV